MKNDPNGGRNFRPGIRQRMCAVLRTRTTDEVRWMLGQSEGFGGPKFSTIRRICRRELHRRLLGRV